MTDDTAAFSILKIKKERERTNPVLVVGGITRMRIFLAWCMASARCPTK
jgi:hypothetical protein